MSYLLDTNVVSEPERPRPDKNVLRWLATVDHRSVYLSALTIGEIRKGLAKLPAGKQRAKIQNWLGDVRNRFSGRILSLTEETFLIWGNMYAEQERNGFVRSTLDSLLEATAAEHDLVLVTRNVRNFQQSPVTIFNPWDE